MLCPRCASQCDPGSRFCAVCGSPLDIQSRPARPISPPPPPPSQFGAAPSGRDGVLRIEIEDETDEARTVLHPIGGSSMAERAPVHDETEVPLDPYDARTPGGRVGGRRPPWLLPLAAGAVVLLLAALVWVFARRESDAEEGAPTRQLPLQLDRQWRETFDGYVHGDGTTDRIFLYRTEEDDATIVAVDGATGETQWEVDSPEEAYGGVALVVDGDPIIRDFDESGGDSVLRRLDGDDGEEIWTAEVSGSGAVVEMDGRHYLSTEGWDGEDMELTAIDLATGETGRRVKAPNLTVQPDLVVARDDDEIEIYDLGTLDRRGQAIPIDDEVTAAAWIDGSLVVAAGDEISRLDEDGGEQWSDRVDSSSIYDLRPTADGSLVITGDEGVSLVRLSGEGIEEQWSRDGYLADVVRAQGDDVALITDDDEFDIVRLSDGELIASISFEWTSEGEPWTVYRDAILFAEYGETGSTYEAYSLPDGELLWELETDGYLQVIDDGVLEVVTIGDGIATETETEIAVYR